jgi:hypothetical protein
MAASSAFVAWCSFRLIQLPRTPSPVPARPHSALLLRSAAHFAALLAQAAVLSFLAELSLPAALLLLVLFLLLAFFITRRTYVPSAGADMTLGMLSLGGLGMNLGWWADNHFLPVKHLCCCMSWPAGSIASSPWMYCGMLLLGVPAMYILRRTPERFSFRRWCCTGPLLLGVPGMVLGMWAGSYLSTLLPALSSSIFVIIHYLCMMAGMLGGMLIPHALGRLLAPWPGSG